MGEPAPATMAWLMPTDCVWRSRRLVPLLLAYGALSWLARAGIHLVCFCSTWAAVVKECSLGPGTVGIVFSVATWVSRLLALRGAWRLIASDAVKYDRLWAELLLQKGERAPTSCYGAPGSTAREAAGSGR
jgi:hypothetical protein